MNFLNKAIIAIITILFLAVPLAQAEDFFYIKKISQSPVNDYILNSPDSEVSLRVTAGSNKQDLIVKLISLVNQSRIGRYFTYTETVTPASNLYMVKFTPYEENNFDAQPTITMQYGDSNQYQEIYYYSWADLSFIKADSQRDTINKTLTFTLPNKKSVMFALFNEQEVVGRASYYVNPWHKGELMTASRDFPRDTKLKVTNMFNKKEVVVTVLDYGPKLCADWTDKEQRLMGPCQERVLDLSKTAFLQLATSTGQGIISEVKIEVLD